MNLPMAPTLPMAPGSAGALSQTEIAELHAEVVLMAKNGVEGVYSDDPAKDPSAEFIPEITHMEALERRLRVMDSTALALCMDNGMPLNVFNMDDERNIARIISGERVGTLVLTPTAEEEHDDGG